MYNRTSESYRVVSCENEKFNVYAAKVMDTGFEIGIMISDMVRPEFPEIIEEKRREIFDIYDDGIDQTEANNKFSEFLSQEPYLSMWNDYQTKAHPIDVMGYDVFIVGEQEDSDGCYIINSNGEKFKSTMSPSRKANANYVKGNQFDFYETFGMTKYDATDKITAVIEFYGEPVKIELEKIK